MNIATKGAVINMNRVGQHTYVNIIKCFKGIAPAYTDEIFHPSNKAE